jgi:hypothetical protein
MICSGQFDKTYFWDCVEYMALFETVYEYNVSI